MSKKLASTASRAYSSYSSLHHHQASNNAQFGGLLQLNLAIDQLDCLDLQLSGVNRHPHACGVKIQEDQIKNNILVVAIKSDLISLEQPSNRPHRYQGNFHVFLLVRLELSFAKHLLPNISTPPTLLFFPHCSFGKQLFGLVVSALPPSLYSWSDPQLLVPLISDWTDPHPSSRTLSRPAIHSKTPAVHHPDHPPPWSCLVVPG
ncbi:hypothetical protein PGT21_028081 [Puccinia graminis f. sp. tritici]|uniref:Uncharacterized protein n=1 Tax=Puccinia graminis f. sp. tritici TaxID=56615 RepID=A0A5B0MP00_PUCGR|nr:hypothetical protein PGT21_028081 [Puccinia graminis f. sp. tritici]